MYFPDHGWVKFDPTPSGASEEARERSVQRARENNESAVDTDETQGTEEWSPTPTQTAEPLTTTGPSNGSFNST